MAGIGFELNKILKRQGYTSLMQAYLYAALIGSGPWLIAVLALAMLGLVMTTSGNAADSRLFFVSISLIYGFTLMLTGPIQVVLTRYAADQQYTNQPHKIFPAFVFSLGWVSLAFSALGMIVFLGFVPGPPLFRLAAAMLMMLVAAIWVAGIFLTALKNYHQVLAGFAVGFVVSFAGAWGLSMMWGVSGAMLGFALGHAVLLACLCAAIYKEIGAPITEQPKLLPYFPKYWDLAVGGFLYNVGIWADKFLFWWFDPASEQVAGLLYASPIYDRVVYFSFLTIVPGMAVFLLKLETDFAVKNEAFYQHVLRKGTLAQIRQCRVEMIEALQDGFGLLLKVQGGVTLLLILCAEQVLNRLGLGAVQAGVFQISLIATFLLVVFMSLLMVLHYLDKRRDAMWCCIAFAATNFGVTWLTILAGERWFGFGFLAATAVGMVITASRVNHHLRNLEYDTFTSQPIYG